jgi:3',5'-cyclic-AMP phosphodiesterase
MRILHLSDLHVEGAPERAYPGVGATLEQSRALVREEAPDYLFVTGDLTSHGSAEAQELALAREWLDALGVPYLCLPGNHDLGANRWRGERSPGSERYEDAPLAETNFGRTFGLGPLEVRDLGPLTAMALSLRSGDPDGVLPALEEALGRGDGPVALLAHYPLLQTRDQGVLAEFGAGDWVPDLVEPLLAIIRAHPRVRLLAAGHVHALTGRLLPGGALQLTAGALGPGASVYRRYTVSGQRLAFSSHLGAGPLGFWERLVPDAYPAEYHLGASHERLGELPLR